jgi:hypothetical protein
MAARTAMCAAMKYFQVERIRAASLSHPPAAYNHLKFTPLAAGARLR